LESKHDQRNQPVMAHGHRSRELPSGQAAYIARVGASGTRQGSHPQWHAARNVALFALRFGCYTPIASRALTKWRIELRERHKTGSVVFDKARGTWRFLRWVEGKRKSQTIGTKQEYPTKAAAWKATRLLPDAIETATPAPTVSALVEQYRVEKMPTRCCSRRSYNAWLDNHIVPKFGQCPITAVQARPVELWLQSLALSPKSRTSIRGLLRILWDFAMWRGDVPTQRNPMELVTVKGASKRMHKPRSLTVAEFQQFIVKLREPFRTISLVCVCFGLRISEALALKWGDVDWFSGRLTVERGIVRQNVDDVKTETSHRQMTIDVGVLEILKTWKQTTQFSAQEDWIFASPVLLGRLPWSYPRVLRVFGKAALDAGIAHVSTHTMRHTHRSWLDAVGTPIAVQQKLMRHADIRTTMNIYGDVVTDEMAVASGKVAGLALNGSQADHRAS
jgi:integrase